MAKVEIGIDTESKKVEVKIDGKKVNNVNNIYISTEEAGYFMLDIGQSEQIDENTRKVTIISASTDPNKEDEQSKANARTRAKASAEYQGMFEFIEPNYTVADLSEMLFGRHRS